MSLKERLQRKKKTSTVATKIKKEVKQAVKSKEWINLYRCVDEHCIALKELYGKAPKIDKKMSLEELQKVYDEIHADKYGHL